jgi:hypothetical protein
MPYAIECSIVTSFTNRSLPVGEVCNWTAVYSCIQYFAFSYMICLSVRTPCRPAGPHGVQTDRQTDHLNYQLSSYVLPLPEVICL